MFSLVKKQELETQWVSPSTFPAVKLRARCLENIYLLTPLASFKASWFCSTFGHLALLHFLL